MKGFSARLALSCMVSSAGGASVWAAAPSAHVAKMCRQQAIEAHPAKPPGAEHGSAQAQRDYFRECVGKMQQQELVLTAEERSTILRNVHPRGRSTLALGAVSEGADVPHGVDLKAFPNAVVGLLPKMAAYRYFTVENIIAIVNPGLSKVVLVIEDR